MTSVEIKISPVAARQVAAALEAGIHELEGRNAYKFPAEVFDVLILLRAIATLRSVDRAIVAATDQTAAFDNMADMEVSPAEAARIEGITRQAIAGRLARHTLPSRRDALGRVRILRSNLKEAL